jgi:hypothetical protein
VLTFAILNVELFPLKLLVKPSNVYPVGSIEVAKIRGLTRFQDPDCGLVIFLQAQSHLTLQHGFPEGESRKALRPES